MGTDTDQVRRRDRSFTGRRTGLGSVCAVAAALVLFGMLAGGEARARAAPVATRPAMGVVDVNAYLGYQQGLVAGTGIVLTPSGEVLTNNHVIRGGTRIRITDPATGRSYAATVVGYSLAADVAVLQLAHASGLATAPVGSSARIRVGDAVTAVGNAGGTGGSPTVTTGTIRGVHRTITVNDDQGGLARLTDLIKTDASLEPGDSGGPLLDASGRVIGIDTAAETGFAFHGGGGSGYAVPIDRALAIAKLIVAGRSTATVHVGPTSFLGVSVGRSDAARRAARGAVVAAVVNGSPADKAGLATGDVITRLAGRTVTSPASLVNVLLRSSPGAALRLSWSDTGGTSHSGTVVPVAGPPQ
jgi:S1-C subfamily serine protease